jgi:hypothetical protein
MAHAGSASRRRPSRLALPALAAAAALVAAAAHSVRRHEPAEATAVRASAAGTLVVAAAYRATVARAGHGVAAEAAAAVEAGDRLVVRPGGLLALADAGGARVELYGGAEARVEADGGDAVLFVARGLVVASTPPAPVGLLLRTPHARATTLGPSRLSLLVGDGFTRAEVSQGRIRFDRISQGVSSEVAAPDSAVAARPVQRPTETLAAERRRPEPRVRKLFGFDFDDGKVPPGFFVGQPVPGPGRPHGSYAMLAGIDYGLGSPVIVGLEQWPQFIDYSPGLVVSFDYWIGADVAELTLQVWSQEAGQNYYLSSPKLAREAWHHAQIRLADLRPRRDTQRPLRATDGVQTILVLAAGRRATASPLYVDDLQLLEYPPAALPSTSTW